jgi:isoleucyl-tRNA synthetase
MAPILAFTSDEMWDVMPHRTTDDTRAAVLNEMPTYQSAWEDKELEARYNRLFDLRDNVMKALEEARTSGMIGKSLEAQVILDVSDDEIYNLFASFGQELKDLFIVSALQMNKAADAKEDGFAVTVEKAQGDKCDRCWMYTTDAYKTEEGCLCARCKKIVLP